jgi:glutaryl-CoA dehydrogenase (non-decarboxylating)
MIDFELSDEHKQVEQMVREWAAREVAPRIHDLDREHRFEPAFLKGMADLHLLGICIPEELGGAGMDYISLGLASEELEYVDTHLRVIMSVHVGLNCMTLMCWGSTRRRSTCCRRRRARRSRPTA